MENINKIGDILMGIFKKMFDSSYKDESEPKKQKRSFFDSLYKDESEPEEQKRSFFDSLYKDESEPGQEETNSSNKRANFISRILNGSSDQKPEISFTDSDDISNISNGLIGRIEYYKKRLNMFSLAVNSIGDSTSPKEKSTIDKYLNLALMFKENLEPYINEKDSISPTTRIQIQMKLDEFIQAFNNVIPEVESLSWLKQIRRTNAELKNIFRNGTRQNISIDEIQKCRDYINTIVANKDKFDTYNNELIGELLISEYRLPMVLIMHEIDSKQDNIQSPFLGLDERKVSEFEKLFMEDYSEFEKLSDRIIRAKAKILATRSYKRESFEKMESLLEELNSRLNYFIVGDYSISEIFLDSRNGFSTLKLFISLRLRMNTMWKRYEEITQGQEK